MYKLFPNNINKNKKSVGIFPTDFFCAPTLIDNKKRQTLFEFVFY